MASTRGKTTRPALGLGLGLLFAACSGGGGGDGQPQNLVAPSFSTQPANVTVTEGDPAVFTVRCNGYPAPTCQWRLADAPIPGATSDTLTIPQATVDMHGNGYTCTATNSAGSLTSRAAVLSVIPGAPTAPVITIQPRSQTVTVPAAATFTVAGTGNPPPTFQWNLDGTPIPSATGTSYTIAVTTLAMSGQSLTVTLANAEGSITSSSATLTVNAPVDAAPVITTQPADQNLVVGGALSLTVEAAGYPATFAYQWYLNGSPVAGATAATYQVPAVAVADAGTYYVTVGNGVGTPARSRDATVTVGSQAFLVAGSVLDAGGQPMAGAQLDLDSTPAQTALSGGDGSYRFAARIPAGTYTIRPSIPGCSSLFAPWIRKITVANADLAVPAFQELAVGYKVSGIVTYAGTRTGRVHVALRSRSGGETVLGATLAAPGAFSIRGVQPGTYALTAVMDTLGQGDPNGNDPAGTGQDVTVDRSDLAGARVALADRAQDLTGMAGPGQLWVSPMHAGAVVTYQPLGEGLDPAQSYTLEWSADASFTPLAGSRSFRSNRSAVLFLASEPSLVDGAAFYFRLQGRAGATASQYSVTPSPVTIGAATGASTVSGRASFEAQATGPLYLVLLDRTHGRLHAAAIQAPASPQDFALTGVAAGSTYQLFCLLDQNGNGLNDAGDPNNVRTGNGVLVQVDGDRSGLDVALASGSCANALRTNHFQGPGDDEGYSVHLLVDDNAKLVTGVAALSGPGLLVPQDLGMDIGSGDRWRVRSREFSGRPSVGAACTVRVRFADGSVETVAPQVTTVLDSFPRSLAPAGNGNHSGTGTDVAPVFTWSAPSSPPADGYLYNFWLNTSGVPGSLWQAPMNAAGFPSSLTSLTWGVDPADPGNLPAIPLLGVGTTYLWSVMVQDSLGNMAAARTEYTP